MEAPNVSWDPIYSTERIIRGDLRWEQVVGLAGVEPFDYKTDVEKEVERAVLKGDTKFKRASVFWDTGAPLIEHDLRSQPARPKEVFGEADHLFVRRVLNDPNASLRDLAIAHNMKADFGVPWMRGKSENVVYKAMADPYFKPHVHSQCSINLDARPYNFVEIFNHQGL